MVTLLVALLLLSQAVAPAGAQKPVPPAGQKPAASLTGEGPGYYFMLGRQYESDGEIDKAIAAHKRAIELAPDSAELRAELAGVYARQDRAREAIETAEQALERDPSNREANRILGSVYAALSGQSQPVRPGDDPGTYAVKAIAALLKARGDGTFDVNIEFQLGRLYLQQKEYAPAIPPLRRVVDDQPGYPEAALMLASAYEGAGQAALAIQTLETALAANPAFARGVLRIAELYEEQQKYRDAADAYARAQKLNPRLDVGAARAAALINAGDAAGAREAAEAALTKKGGTDPALLYLLAQAQRRLRQFDLASATVAKLTAAFPQDVRGLYVKALLLDDTGRTREALAAFEELLAVAPGDAAATYEYANLLEKSGRGADAERVYRGMLEKDPRDATALNGLGYMLAVRGERLDEAVALLKRALEVEPGNPSILDSLGWAYFRQGRLDQADAPLTEAAARLTQSSVVQDHLGDLRMRQRRPADAIAAWERALAGDGASIERGAIEKKVRDARARLRK